LICLISQNNKIQFIETIARQAEFPEQLEALIYSRRNLSTSKSWLGKIASLSVNTDYDQKEQMFRNFLGGMGPLSSPVLSYEFDAEMMVPQNLTVLWLDPIDRLAEVNQLRIEESNLVSSPPICICNYPFTFTSTLYS
jgi:hypothetical protein